MSAAQQLTTQQYLTQVRRELAELPASDRQRALADLAELLAQLDPPARAALGSPADYAQQVCDALVEPADPARPRWQPLGLPVEVRLPDDARLLARSFDPTNPALIGPRLFGGGWTVNWGAVAVRTHLLRPDDVDPEVLEAVPRGALAAARAVPAAVAGAAVIALAARWRTLPSQVPTGWGPGGRVSRWGDRRSLLAVAAAGVLPALWAQGAVPGNGERLVRSGRAASLAVLAASSIAATLAWAAGDRAPATRPGAAAGPRYGLIAAGALPVAGATMLAVVVLPVRAGLRAVWRDRAAPPDQA